MERGDVRPGALRRRRNLTGGAKEVGTEFGQDDLEAVRDVMNGWCVVAICLRKAGHASLSALRTPQLFVPLIKHASNISRRAVLILVP